MFGYAGILEKHGSVTDGWTKISDEQPQSKAMVRSNFQLPGSRSMLWRHHLDVPRPQLVEEGSQHGHRRQASFSEEAFSLPSIAADTPLSCKGSRIEVSILKRDQPDFDSYQRRNQRARMFSLSNKENSTGQESL